MSRGERVAEFNSLEDAKAFWRMKGRDDYEMCAGVNMPWAVRTKLSHEIGAGHPEQPPERVSEAWDADGDDEQ